MGSVLYEMIAILFWFAMLRPIGGTSVCELCKQQFWTNNRDITLQNNKKEYCSNHKNFIDCADNAKCDPDNEHISWLVVATGIRGSYRAHCGVSSQCLDCQHTFNESHTCYDGNDGACNTFIKNKQKYCRDHIIFIECLDSEKCDPAQEPRYFENFVGTTMGNLGFYCGFDFACKNCLATYHDKIENVTFEGNKKEYCMWTKWFWACAVKKQCDIEKQGFYFYVEALKVQVMVAHMCVCDRASVDRCLAKVEEGPMPQYSYFACRRMEAIRECITTEYGCDMEPVYGAKITESIRVSKHFMCRTTVIGAHGSEADGASVCSASWVMILLAAIGIYGQF